MINNNYMKQIYLIIFIALAVAGCGNKANYDATGTFEATEIIVSSEASGKILNLNVEEGDKLAENEKVGVIDSLQLYLEKLQLLKNVNSVSANKPDIKIQISALQEQIKKQKYERNRIVNLLKMNAATTKQLDDIESAITVLEKQLSAMESTLGKNSLSINAQSSSIEIQIAQIEDKLNKCSIVSPVKGTVLAKYMEAGELAVNGSQLFKIADIENIYLRAYITSGQLSKIKIGDKVDVTAIFGGDKNKKYSGIITWISDKSEFTPKNIQTNDDRESIVYAIKIGVKNDGYIKIGMYGEVLFK